LPKTHLRGIQQVVLTKVGLLLFKAKHWIAHGMDQNLTLKVAQLQMAQQVPHLLL